MAKKTEKAARCVGRKPGEHGLRAARAGEYFKKRTVIQCQKVFKGQIRGIKTTRFRWR